MNLSQLALIGVLDEYNAASKSMDWGSYFSNKIDAKTLDEKDAILEFNKYAEIIYNDEKLKHKLIIDLSNIITTIPNKKGQSDFIKYIGISGADTIRDILTEKWNLEA